MKKRLITFRAEERILKDMEDIMKAGRYRDKTDVFHAAIRELAKEYGIIKANNNSRVRRR